MLLLSYIWPIALVIICNTVYQVCAKSVPAEINPLASLTVTYLVAAIMCYTPGWEKEWIINPCNLR